MLKKARKPASLVQSHRVRYYSPLMQRAASRATVTSNPGLVDPTGAILLTDPRTRTIYSGTRPYTEQNFAHETAHLADADTRNRSSWPFFKLMLNLAARAPIDNQNSEWLRTFPGIGRTPPGTWGGPTEAFAEIIARSGGDMTKVPLLVRPFFGTYMGNR